MPSHFKEIFCISLNLKIEFQNSNLFTFFRELLLRCFLHGLKHGNGKILSPPHCHFIQTSYVQTTIFPIHLLYIYASFTFPSSCETNHFEVTITLVKIQPTLIKMQCCISYNCSTFEVLI